MWFLHLFVVIYVFAVAAHSFFLSSPTHFLLLLSNFELSVFDLIWLWLFWLRTSNGHTHTYTQNNKSLSSRQNGQRTRPRTKKKGEKTKNNSIQNWWKIQSFHIKMARTSFLYAFKPIFVSFFVLFSLIYLQTYFFCFVFDHSVCTIHLWYIFSHLLLWL